MLTSLKMLMPPTYIAGVDCRCVAFVMCNLDSMARLLIRLTSRGVVYVAYVSFNSPVAVGSYALRLLHTFNLSVSPANNSVSAVLHTALKVVNNRSNSPWLSSDAYICAPA